MWPGGDMGRAKPRDLSGRNQDKMRQIMTKICCVCYMKKKVQEEEEEAEEVKPFGEMDL